MVRKAWVDARHVMASQELWGLTLLERNLRELSLLGIEEVVLQMEHAVEPDTLFRYPIPAELKISVEVANNSDVFQPLRDYLQRNTDLILLMEGHALNDRRIIKELLGAKSSCGVVSASGSNKAAAAVVSESEAALFEKTSSNGLTSVLSAGLKNSQIANFNMAAFDSYINKLRREMPVYLLLVENSADLKEADATLRLTTHKGVNDFVAKYIHPPLEFGISRLLCKTVVTPNQVTLLNLFLAATATYLFATGEILTGVLLAVVKCLLDGVDGKLARFLMKFSKVGDMLDHAGDTIFDGLWYLALGWHFSQGDFNSPAGQVAVMLVASYLIHKTVPGIFKKIHAREIYDFAPVDEFVRLVGARTNNNMWVLMIGTLAGFTTQAFYVVSFYMFTTAVWFVSRFIWVTFISRPGKSKPLALTLDGENV